LAGYNLCDNYGVTCDETYGVIGQWTKVANPFLGEIWAKFEIPLNVDKQICNFMNFVHLKS
jgi:hypothetical protein